MEVHSYASPNLRCANAGESKIVLEIAGVVTCRGDFLQVESANAIVVTGISVGGVGSGVKFRDVGHIE
jgi:hypothetical protein